MDSIPPRIRPEDCTPLRTQTDLQQHWRMLMGELGFSARSLWLNVLDETGRPTSVLIEIDDIPGEPDDEHLDRLVDMCRHFMPEGGGSATVVFLLTRPGPRGMTASELSWARGLQSAVSRAGLTVWPVHCANHDELTVFAPDDLASSA